MRFLTLTALGLGLTLGMGCRTAGDDDDVDTDTDTDADTDTDTDTDTDSDTSVAFDCDDGPSDPETFWGTLTADQVRTEPYTDFDAGLQAIFDAMPEDDSIVELETPLQVTKAVVTHTPYVPEGTVPGDFWFADEAGALFTFDDGDDEDGEVIRVPESGSMPPGSVVSFKVNKIQRYFGQPQIIDASDFVIHEGETREVYVQDLTDGTEITYAEHGRQMVRIWSEVKEVRGPCGSPTCYTIETHGHEYVLRIRKDDYLVGDCLPIAAPVGTFDGEVQFNISDFDAVGFPF